MRKRAAFFLASFFCSMLLINPSGRSRLNTTADGFARPSGSVHERQKDDSPSGLYGWSSIGPYGGSINGLAWNPQNHSEVYASCAGSPSQIYKSVDGGLHWFRIAVLNAAIQDVATSPHKGRTVYLLGARRLFISSDGGASFAQIFAYPARFNGTGGRIAFHPSNPEILFISGSYMTNPSTGRNCPAVCRSSDGGRSWTVSKIEPQSRYGVIYDLGVHPKYPNIIYACGRCWGEYDSWWAGVYKSTDGGGQFADITDDRKTFYSANALILHPSDPNLVWVAHGWGVTRTMDGGRTWLWQNDPPDWWMPCQAISLDPSNPRQLVVLSGVLWKGFSGCWSSADGGLKWYRTGEGVYGMGTRLLVSGKTIIAGTQAGIFKSQNGGAVWRTITTGILAADVNLIGMTTTSPPAIYCQAAGYLLNKSEDGGEHWVKCPDFYLETGEYIRGLFVHPMNPKTIYVLSVSGGLDEVLKSEDGGETGRQIHLRHFEGMAGDPARPDRIAIAGSVHRTMGICLTHNGGDSWRNIQIMSAELYIGRTVAFAPSNLLVIYASGRHYKKKQFVLYKTNDGGITWSDLSWPFSRVINLAVDWGDSQILYVMTDSSGVYRSPDGGRTWTLVLPAIGVSSIALNKDDPNEVFIGNETGVFFSRDRGLTFTDISKGLLNKQVLCLDFHAPTRTVFAGTQSAGVWKKRMD